MDNFHRVDVGKKSARGGPFISASAVEQRSLVQVILILQYVSSQLGGTMAPTPALCELQTPLDEQRGFHISRVSSAFALEHRRLVQMVRMLRHISGTVRI